MTEEETGAIVDLPVHLNSSAVYCMLKLISFGLFLVFFLFSNARSRRCFISSG